MMTLNELDDYLLGLDGSWLDLSTDPKLSIYRIGHGVEGEKIFATIEKDSRPIRISLKCDSHLAIKLRQDFETVLPSENLNKKYWNTIICSGQLSDEDIKSFIRLSYDLVTGATPQS